MPIVDGSTWPVMWFAWMLIPGRGDIFSQRVLGLNRRGHTPARGLSATDIPELDCNQAPARRVRDKAGAHDGVLLDPTPDPEDI